MRAAAALALIVTSASALADNHARITAYEMVAAIREAVPDQLDGVDARTVTPRSVRVLRCIGPDEEPSEFECTWQTRGANRRWTTHKSWLAIDGRGWHFIG